jgi:hypothetical protein
MVSCRHELDGIRDGSAIGPRQTSAGRDGYRNPVDRQSDRADRLM